MADLIFDHPRLVALYDVLEGTRVDLAGYLNIVEEVSGRSVLDLGCGTGTFALLLADRGIEVIGVTRRAAAVRRRPARMSSPARVCCGCCVVVSAGADTRQLARCLSVSRTTVTVAYDRLSGEGFIKSRVGAGTFVGEDVLRPAGRTGTARFAQADLGNRRTPDDV